MNTTKPVHEYHLLTHCCIHCGQTAAFIEQQKISCHRFDNVIAMTHKRYHQILQEYMSDVVRTPTKNNDPNTE